MQIYLIIKLILEELCKKNDKLKKSISGENTELFIDTLSDL
jgi:hypothetical protein